MNPDTDTDPEDEALARALRASRVMHDAPEAVLQKAMALFEARVPAPAPRSRLRALLAFDSAGASPLAFGQRSGGSAMRQLLFSLEGRDIDLRIAPAPEAGLFELSGQVLGPDAGGTVLLVQGDGSAEHAATLNELGEFRLLPVAAGTWQLTLELGALAIDLPPLEIPLPPPAA
jgi:hypothetical protein